MQITRAESWLPRQQSQVVKVNNILKARRKEKLNKKPTHLNFK